MPSKNELYAKNLRRFRESVDNHDKDCEYPAWGIGLASYDMDWMNIAEGEELWANVNAYAWDVQPDKIKVLCDAPKVGEGDPSEQEEIGMLVIFGNPYAKVIDDATQIH